MQLPMVLPGIRLSTSPKQYFPLRGMQLMIFKGDRWEGFGEIMGAE
jgi:branched-chain amino acid transport system substrate-binding protein